MQVGDLGHLLFDPVELVPTGVDGAVAVGHDDVAVTGGQEQLHNGHGRGACAGGDHLHFLLPLPHHLQGVGEPGQGDDGGAVLVVVEDGDVAFFLQLPLDFKAAGRGDVLQVDPAEGTGNQGHGVDKFVHVVGPDAQGKGVHPAEGLKQHAFALHHRHTGLGPDVAQAQDGGAVGDDGAEVVPPGQVVGPVEVLLDFQAGQRHAGGIGQGQIVPGGHGDPRRHFNFPAPCFMEPEGFFCIVHVMFPPYGPTARTNFIVP